MGKPSKINRRTCLPDGDSRCTTDTTCWIDDRGARLSNGYDR